MRALTAYSCLLSLAQVKYILILIVNVEKQLD